MKAPAPTRNFRINGSAVVLISSNDLLNSIRSMCWTNIQSTAEASHIAGQSQL